MSGLWQDLDAWQPQRLDALLAGDFAPRAAALIHQHAGIRFDWCKTHLDAAAISHFCGLADAVGLDGARRALLSGEMVNPSENRAAEHSAERGVGDGASVELARLLHGRMRALIDAIEGGAFGEIRHILHIGIGGSALGPQLLVDALARHQNRYEVAVVANVDGAALDAALSRFDPATTLVALASKTFTTSETLMNARSALRWMEEGGVADPMGRFVALTAAPEKAIEWGIDETRILPFAPTIGGRYSLWSSIGFPAALALGWDGFAHLLAGAEEMDRHFAAAPWRENIPVLAAFADLLYSQRLGASTRAVFAYDERLRLLPPYLQQLEMESNGKGVRADGSKLTRPSAPITWGGTGTDAQHAVFQLLHQGTHLVPVEFVAVKTPEHALDGEHHAALIGNCIAQGAALMRGQASDDPHRAYPGNRPSVTILLDRLDPAHLGALIAFYEHRTFANATLMGINPFDQFGVELGKAMARALDDGDGDFDPATEALMDAAFGGFDVGGDLDE